MAKRLEPASGRDEDADAGEVRLERLDRDRQNLAVHRADDHFERSRFRVADAAEQRAHDQPLR
jgi:hypothetical protein